MKVFKSLFHVSIFCNDAEKSLDFYQKLGCEIAFTLIDQEGDDPWDYYLKLCEGQYIELQPCKANNPHPHPQESRYYEDQTVWHFSMETDNMVAMIDELRKNGISIWENPDPGAKEVKCMDDVVLSPDGCFVCWIFDPDGNPIELMEQTKHSKQRLADIRLAEEK